MNSRMTRNSQLSTTELKQTKKLSKQPEQEQNHRNGDHIELSVGRRRGENGKKGTGNK